MSKLTDVETKELIAELDARLDNEDPVAVAFMEKEAEHWVDDPEPFPWEIEAANPPFARLSDWDLDDLHKAIREDDGRRAIDVLRRAL